MIRSMVPNDNFRDNFDRIFGKEVVQDKEMAEAKAKPAKKAPVLPVPTPQGHKDTRHGS